MPKQDKKHDYYEFKIEKYSQFGCQQKKNHLDDNHDILRENWVLGAEFQNVIYWDDQFYKCGMRMIEHSSF